MKKRGRREGEEGTEEEKRKEEKLCLETSGLSLKEHICTRSGLYFYVLINP